jgi:phosphohistidine swiveling domain-containing protein
VGDGEDVATGADCAETRTAQTNDNKNARQITLKPFLDSGIANSVRKSVIINRGTNPTSVGPIVVGQTLRLPAAIPSATEAVALQTRSRPVTISTQRFLFVKLDFLAKQIRVLRVVL